MKKLSEMNRLIFSLFMMGVGGPWDRVTRWVCEEIAPKWCPTHFVCQSLCITVTVVKRIPKTWATSVIYEKTAHSKPLPNGRKFAQSGHPAVGVCGQLCSLIAKRRFAVRLNGFVSKIGRQMHSSIAERRGRLATGSNRFFKTYILCWLVTGWCMQQQGLFFYFFKLGQCLRTHVSFSTHKQCILSRLHTYSIATTC
jgi:hypothetical protein